VVLWPNHCKPYAQTSVVSLFPAHVPCTRLRLALLITIPSDSKHATRVYEPCGMLHCDSKKKWHGPFDFDDVFHENV
jgi:hypothetical protein